MTTNLAATIDAFGKLNAQIAELKIQQDALKASLAYLGPGNFEGDDYRLSITMPQREKLSDELKTNIKDVVEKYRETLSHQYLTAHAPKVATPTFTVRARTGKALAA